jgi:nucleoside-diphosphate-sugar epimerase
LIRGLRQHGHSVFGLVRSAESTRMLTEMGAEALIGDALDAASVRAAIARVRPDAVINELTSLPRHYTPAEMRAAAERDSRVRREGNVNLLGGMRESGVRRYVLQASGFWYAPGPGLADESSPLAVDASPGVAASARTYVELESTAFRASEIDCVAMRYGFFYGPGTWYTNGGDMGEQVRRQQVPIIGAGQGDETLRSASVPRWFEVVDGFADFFSGLVFSGSYALQGADHSHFDEQPSQRKE